jgi:hypothetical protein
MVDFDDFFMISPAILDAFADILFDESNSN